MTNKSWDIKMVNITTATTPSICALDVCLSAIAFSAKFPSISQTYSVYSTVNVCHCVFVLASFSCTSPLMQKYSPLQYSTHVFQSPKHLGSSEFGMMICGLSSAWQVAAVSLQWSDLYSLERDKHFLKYVWLSQLNVSHRIRQTLLNANQVV